jgi:hypothetical protein
MTVPTWVLMCAVDFFHFDNHVVSQALLLFAAASLHSS